MTDKLAIVFDGPPGPKSGRFIEVELNGTSISFGEWQENGDFWELVLPDRWAALAKARSDADALLPLLQYAQHRIACSAFGGEACDCGLARVITALPGYLRGDSNEQD